MKTFFLLSVFTGFFFCYTISLGQNPQWLNYTNSQQVSVTAEEGNFLWIGTVGSGLVRLDKNTGNKIFYNKGNSQIPSNHVQSLVIDNNGNKWLIAGQPWNALYLVKFDGINWQIVNPPWNPWLDLPTFSCLTIHNNDLWIGENSGNLIKYDGANWEIDALPNSYQPNSIAFDSSGNIWVASWGLLKYDGASWTIQNGFPGDVVSALAVEGNIVWAGVASGFGGGMGLGKFDGNNWTIYSSSNSSIPFNYINTITIDNNGKKWIGTTEYFWQPDSGAITVFDNTNWQIYSTSNSDLKNATVYNILIENSGTKWIGTQEGLYRFDDVNWTSYRVANSGMPIGQITSVAFDINGDKWIGVNSGYSLRNGGLVHFDGTNWAMYDNSNSGLSDNVVYDISIDRNGNKWIVTASKLFLFDGTNWTSYIVPNTTWPLSKIAIDGNDNKWIGTSGNGMAKFDGTN